MVAGKEVIAGAIIKDTSQIIDHISIINPTPKEPKEHPSSQETKNCYTERE